MNILSGAIFILAAIVVVGTIWAGRDYWKTP